MKRNLTAKHHLARILKNPRTITTSCSGLDVVLGGGIETGYITEISGESSVGKTQFCLQLCINAQLPTQLGGLDADVIFVDTEKTFSSERLVEMLHSTFQQLNAEGKELMKDRCDVEKFLSRLYLFRCIEAVELLAVVHQLAHFVKNHPKVGLIIIDSVAQCLRSEENKMRMMFQITQVIRKLVIHQPIAALLVNHVTTRFTASRHASAVTVAALGETWSHVANVKIFLQRPNHHHSLRVAHLMKSPTQPPNQTNYQITSAGIRDLDFNSGGKSVKNSNEFSRIFHNHGCHQPPRHNNDDDVSMTKLSGNDVTPDDDDGATCSKISKTS